MAYFPTSLTMQDAASSLQPGLDAIRGGSADIDLSRMDRFDSAAVAALLVWRRAAVVFWRCRGVVVWHCGVLVSQCRGGRRHHEGCWPVTPPPQI
jgi:hypothetical protein